jgi:hypothetical protein
MKELVCLRYNYSKTTLALLALAPGMRDVMTLQFS